MTKRHWHRVRLICAALCIAAGMGLSGLGHWTHQNTAGDRPRAL